VGALVQNINSLSRKEVHYANVFQLGHNAFEFLLELGQHEGDTHTRIYLSPMGARILSELLRETLELHEQAFG
jgi:hypothetical protein